jgi:hypothetical protein
VVAVLTVTKPVYYCEFCKRHRLTAQAIEKHEPRCIYNPLRNACGWHRDIRPSAPRDFALVFKDDPDVEWLRKEMDGCPACMLAVIVQARGLGLSDAEAWDFDYKAEVERVRDRERQDRFADVW